SLDVHEVTSPATNVSGRLPRRGKSRAQHRGRLAQRHLTLSTRGPSQLPMMTAALGRRGIVNVCLTRSRARATLSYGRLLSSAIWALTGVVLSADRPASRRLPAAANRTSPVREAAASPHLMQACNFVRIGSRAD